MQDCAASAHITPCRCCKKTRRALCATQRHWALNILFVLRLLLQIHLPAGMNLRPTTGAGTLNSLTALEDNSRQRAFAWDITTIPLSSATLAVEGLVTMCCSRTPTLL